MVLSLIDVELPLGTYSIGVVDHGSIHWPSTYGNIAPEMLLL